jgi:DHA1 family multidrug resistance protein-like MFS transporter
LTFVASTATQARLLLVPLYAASTGASPAEVGLLFAAQAITQAVLSIPMGMLADRFGRRRVMIVALACGLAGAVLASIGGMPLLFVSQAFAGVSAASTATVLLAAIAAAAPPERLGRAMGAQVLGQQMGLLVGPPLGGLLLSVSDARTAFLVIGLLFVVAMPLAFFGIDPRRYLATDTPSFRSSIRLLAGAHGLFAAAVFTSIGTVMWGVQSAFLPLFAVSELRLDAAQIGLLLALQGTTNVAARLPSGWLFDRVNERHKIYFAGACVGIYAIGLALVPRVTDFWQLAAVVTVLTPILGTAYVALPAIFARSSPPGRPGVAMGVYSLLIALGIAVGPAIFGPFMTISFASGYTTAAALCAAAVFLALFAQTRAARSGRIAARAS